MVALVNSNSQQADAVDVGDVHTDAYSFSQVLRFVYEKPFAVRSDWEEEKEKE